MRPHLHLVTTPASERSADARALLVSALSRMGLRALLEVAHLVATRAGEHPDATPDQCLAAHAAGDLLTEALEACGPRRVG
jgi:hypothetical protein